MFRFILITLLSVNVSLFTLASEHIHGVNLTEQTGKIIDNQNNKNDTTLNNTTAQIEKQSLIIAHRIKTILDLSHPLENATIHWPDLPGFTYETLFDGVDNVTGHYRKAESIRMGIHTGTHLDAPIHFHQSSWSVEQIPLDRLIDVPLRVVDLSQKVKTNRTYAFTKEDFQDPSTGKSLVEPKSVILVYTGISQQYNKGANEYYGYNGNNSLDIKIPGFSESAATYLVEQGVYGVGLDSPSADSTATQKKGSLDLIAHRIFNEKNVFILENVNSKLEELLSKMKDESFRLTIAPLAIKGGSGSPVRLLAVSDFCPKSSSTNSSAFGSYSIPQPFLIVAITILATIISLRINLNL